MNNRSPKKLLWIFLAFFILFLAITPPLFLYTARSYLASDAFRERAGNEVSNALQAEGSFAPFRWNGTSCFTESYNATGLPGGTLKKLRAENVRADFNLGAIWQRTWQIDQLSIGRFQVVGSSTTEATVRNPSLQVAGINPLAALLPNKSKLLEATAELVDIHWRQENSDLLSYTGGRWVVKPGDTGVAFTGHGGNITHPAFPGLEMDTLEGSYQNNQVYVSHAAFKPGDKGLVELNGEAFLSPEFQADFGVDYEALPVELFLNEDWRVRLRGNVTGHTDIRYRAFKDPHPRQEGHIRLLDGTLKALPILDQMATFTRTERFRILVLNQAEANYLYAEDRLYVSEINAESDGLLKVEGALAIENDMIEGLLHVGVSPNTLQWIPGSQAKVFTTERDGYQWASMRVTGPLDNPQEDLSERLLTAAGEAIVERVAENAEVIGEQLKGVADEALKALAPFFE